MHIFFCLLEALKEKVPLNNKFQSEYSGFIYVYLTYKGYEESQLAVIVWYLGLCNHCPKPL